MNNGTNEQLNEEHLNQEVSKLFFKCYLSRLTYLLRQTSKVSKTLEVYNRNSLIINRHGFRNKYLNLLTLSFGHSSFDCAVV